MSYLKKLQSTYSCERLRKAHEPRDDLAVDKTHKFRVDGLHGALQRSQDMHSNISFGVPQGWSYACYAWPAFTTCFRHAELLPWL